MGSTDFRIDEAGNVLGKKTENIHIFELSGQETISVNYEGRIYNSWANGKIQIHENSLFATSKKDAPPTFTLKFAQIKTIAFLDNKDWAPVLVSLIDGRTLSIGNFSSTQDFGRFFYPIFKEKLNQFRRKRKAEAEATQKQIEQEDQQKAQLIEEEAIERLQKLLKVSTRVKLDMMRDILKLDVAAFNDKILDWAADFGFKIDGDYVVVEGGDVSKFISVLDKEFAEWGQKAATKDGKV